MTLRIYTRTGDAGQTGLFGGGRVSKANMRVAAYGEVDELNAVIGVAITAMGPGMPQEAALLGSVQADLFAIGAHLASPGRDGRPKPVLPELPTARIAEMEKWIDDAEKELPPLKSFILPGGSPGGAALHHARTVCRRAERSVVLLAEHEEVNAQILIYLNRLSDFLFDMARVANLRDGVEETRWLP